MRNMKGHHVDLKTFCHIGYYFSEMPPRSNYQKLDGKICLCPINRVKSTLCLNSGWSDRSEVSHKKAHIHLTLVLQTLITPTMSYYIIYARICPMDGTIPFEDFQSLQS